MATKKIGALRKNGGSYQTTIPTIVLKESGVDVDDVVTFKAVPGGIMMYFAKSVAALGPQKHKPLNDPIWRRHEEEWNRILKTPKQETGRPWTKEDVKAEVKAALDSGGEQARLAAERARYAALSPEEQDKESREKTSIAEGERKRVLEIVQRQPNANVSFGFSDDAGNPIIEQERED